MSCYSIPEEARADSYGGPKTEHKKLSKIDRETIVELYSKLEGIVTVVNETFWAINSVNPVSLLNRVSVQ